MLLRNTIGVLLGLLSATLIITVVINIDPKWVEYNGNFPFKRWQMVVTTARDEFFIALLIAGGVASIVGGIITSLIVKEAKQAYAIFIGFILFLIAVADIIFVTDHPTFYEIGIFFTFFPFSWLGGKIVDSIFKIKKK